jgi:hypothetical protein
LRQRLLILSIAGSMYLLVDEQRLMKQSIAAVLQALLGLMFVLVEPWLRLRDCTYEDKEGRECKILG